MFQNYADVVTTKDLCKMLGISKKKAYELLQSHDILSRKIGSTYRIPKQNIIKFITQTNEGGNQL